jgi:hypothetical protein
MAERYWAVVTGATGEDEGIHNEIGMIPTSPTTPSQTCFVDPGAEHETVSIGKSDDCSRTNEGVKIAKHLDGGQDASPWEETGDPRTNPN